MKGWSMEVEEKGIEGLLLVRDGRGSFFRVVLVMMVVGEGEAFLFLVALLGTAVVVLEVSSPDDP